MEDDEISINISDVMSSLTISMPGNPNIGDIWVDTTSNMINSYNGNDWVSIVNDTGTINLDELSFPIPVEWEHEFPPFHQVEEMCKEYPGLEKAYENFKTFYKLVEQDWHGKQKERDT